LKSITNENYKIVYQPKNKGEVWVHPHHSSEELVENMGFAIILANKSKIVKLLPYIEGQFIRNPDAEINGKLADFKRPNKTQHLHNAIQTHIRNANRQGAVIVVLDLRRFNNHQAQIIRGIMNGTQEGRNRNVKEIWLIMEEERLIEITRSQAKEQAVLKKLLD
jgi:Contact-dependent growth inhibition CdiA C-terminal domain